MENYTECETLPDFYVREDDDAISSLADWAEALFAVLNIIVLITSFCGNLGALLILYKSEVSRRSTKLYLTSLAICDLLLGLSSTSVDITQLLFRYRAWVFGWFLCPVLPFIQTAMVTGVALFLVTIAVERYLCIVRAVDRLNTAPARASIWTHNWIGPYWIVGSIWIFSFGISLPNLWYYERKSFWTYIAIYEDEMIIVRPRNETCTTYYICSRNTFDHWNIGYYSFLLVVILIPTICFLYCYISLLTFIRRHMKHMRNTGGNNECRINRSRKSLRLILGLILINLLFRLPVWCFAVITNLVETPVNKLTLLALYGTHLLSNINTTINPFVYAICNDSIRATRTHSSTTSGGNQRPGGVGQRESGDSVRGCCCRSFVKIICCRFLEKGEQSEIATTTDDFILNMERKMKRKVYDLTKSGNIIFGTIQTFQFRKNSKNDGESVDTKAIKTKIKPDTTTGTVVK